MKAFWWFKNQKIAGMARPGFNCTHWFELPFDEAVLMGWLGQYSSGDQPYHLLEKHSQTYIKKIAPFYGLDELQTDRVIDKLNNPRELKKIFEKIRLKTELLESYDCTPQSIHFSFSKQRLRKEIQFLKENQIKMVISLTEKHHDKTELSEHFELRHYSIKDLGAPNKQQVLDMATDFQVSKLKNEAVSVHCLAGIGRTSTMVLAAQLLAGEDFEQLKSLIKKRNPNYILTGEQLDFIHSLIR